MFMGLYVSYIHPRYYKFTLFKEEYKIGDVRKFIIADLFFHILAFVFIAYLYKPYYTPFKVDFPFVTSIFIVCVFSIVFYRKATYNIQLFELLSVFVVANMMYLMLFDNPKK